MWNSLQSYCIYNASFGIELKLQFLQVKLAMDWKKASDYCGEIGGDLPTPTENEHPLMQVIFKEFHPESKIPLGFVNENNKWMQIRHGKKEDSGITKVKPSQEILKLFQKANEFAYETGLKKDSYTTVMCEHRNSALSFIKNQQCDEGFVLFAINNASKCYLFYEFADPFMEANGFAAVSSYCKSRNAELFNPIDSGDLSIMQKIGEATGYARLTDISPYYIYRQYGYINQKVKNDKEEPITAAGHNYTAVGINITASNISEGFCFMLELPGGSLVRSSCDRKSDFALCTKDTKVVYAKKFVDIFGTEEVIITDLKSEKTSDEIDDLSYLGVAPEAKRNVRVLVTQSLLYLIFLLSLLPYFISSMNI
uniref:C-type lectin domain-containing protein n=1 Tax=Onchocerca volvulus TaxID=6282 RepID=A0A8R1TZM6_ONCVO